MNKKIMAVSIAIFLAILFLSTIGSFYTGFVILSQSDITLENYPYPFIKNNVYNGLYIVLPTNYNSEEQEAALLIANSLKGTQPVNPNIITENNLPKGNHNLILIGDPCNNKLIAEELNTNRCSLGLNSGEGLLELVNHERTSTLIVSGVDDGLEKAAKVIAKYNYYPLKGKNIVVKGSRDLTLNYY